MTITIPLTQGKSTVIDDADADLAKMRWHASNCNKHFYARRGGNPRTMHREIMARILGRPLRKGEIVDHIDRDTLNNTRSNLRVATYKQNVRHAQKKSYNSHGFKGVTIHKPTGLWRSAIRTDGGRKSLGYYKTPEEAFVAYCEGSMKYHGEFGYFDRALYERCKREMGDAA